MSLVLQTRAKHDYFLSVAVAGICAVVSLATRTELGMTASAMIYLLGVTVVSTFCSRGAAILNCILSVLSFYFFCVPPFGSFLVMESSVVLTLIVMMLVALVITSLTDRMRRQTDATHRAEIAIETERMRNALLSAVSHDLKTPLVSIYGAATSILDQGERLTPADRRALIKDIAEEAGNLNRLLTNLLEMTRLDAGLELKKDWQSVEEITEAALARLEDSFRNRPVTVNVPEDLPLIRVDESLMQHLLVNVLENAVKYTPEGSPIRIVASGDATRVKISIHDSGPGFKPGTEDQVFERFYRANSPGVHGMGLGLTICRAIVKAHGGKIRAENAPEGGAVLHIELPTGGPFPTIDPLPEGASR